MTTTSEPAISEPEAALDPTPVQPGAAGLQAASREYTSPAFQTT